MAALLWPGGPTCVALLAMSLLACQSEEPVRRPAVDAGGGFDLGGMGDVRVDDVREPSADSDSADSAPDSDETITDTDDDADSTAPDIEMPDTAPPDTALPDTGAADGEGDGNDGAILDAADANDADGDTTADPWPTVPGPVDGTLSLVVVALPTGAPSLTVPHVAGSFNGWTHEAMQPSVFGSWRLDIPLVATGSVAYKFTAGNWESEEIEFRGPGNDRRLDWNGDARVVAHVVRGFAGQPRAAGSTSGEIRVVTDFEIPQFGRTTTLRVYLPPDYGATERRYPVLYMHDAQNLFDTASSGFGVEWQVDEALQRLFFEGAVGGLIVVGVDNGPERACDFSPWPNATGCEGRAGRGDAYATFFVDTLKPWVDETFRTLASRESTWIAGSSRGGMAAFYIGMKHQEVFSRIGAFSPTMLETVLQESMSDFVAEQGRRRPMRIHLDYGTAEQVLGYDAPTLIAGLDLVYDALVDAGFSEDDEVRRVIVPGAIHNEADWAARFPGTLEWLAEALR